MATKKDLSGDEWTHCSTDWPELHCSSQAAIGDCSTVSRKRAQSEGTTATRTATTQANLCVSLVAEPGMSFGFGKNPQQLETETLAALRAGASTLKEKAPEDADAYKQFVLEVAQSVAGAAKGTSAAESAEIEKIRSALA